MQRIWVRYLLALLLTGVALGLVTLAQHLLVFFELLSREPSNLTVLQFFSMIALQAAIFLPVFWIAFRKLGIRAFASHVDFSVGEMLLAFGGLMALNMGVGILMRLLGVEVSQFDDFNVDTLRGAPFVFIAMTVLIAPVYEEVIFRGYLLKLLAGKNPDRFGKTLATLATSVIFAAIHMDLDAMLPIFILSLYLCWWTLKKESIALPVTIHMMQNLMASIGFLYYPELL